MNPALFYIPKGPPSLEFARDWLRRQGVPITEAPGPEITHLLLPVPTSKLTEVEALIKTVPENCVILGGGLPEGLRQRTADFLKDPTFLAANAAITARCAIRLAAAQLPQTLEGCPVLILGWGRIGKFLASLLKALGADTTVAARKDGDRGLLDALGHHSAVIADIPAHLPGSRIVFNTIPAPVVSQEEAALCGPDAILIDLASTPGIDGGHVLHARGLPGKMAPETAGVLIARTALRYLQEATP